MTVRNEPLTSPTRPAARPRVGFLRPSHIERAFMALLYAALFGLVVLSVLGTFYGRLGANAPLDQPLRVWADITATPLALGIAAAIQLVLTVIQWGARQLARRDRRWWLLYLAALAISVYYNFQAYWAPLTELTVWYVAVTLIVAGDVLPEFMAVKHE